jgi:hypothetical protein
MDMAESLVSAAGVRLTRREYQLEFGARLWLADEAGLGGRAPADRRRAAMVALSFPKVTLA